MADNVTGTDETRAIPEHYKSLNSESLLRKLKNLDDLLDFAELKKLARDVESRNFFVDFGHDSAWGAFDMEHDGWQALLDAPRHRELDTRWINIWSPHEQEHLIKSLTRKYRFTPRLGGLMYQSPQFRGRERVSKHAKSSSTSGESKSSSPNVKFSVDTEKAIASESTHQTDEASDDLLETLNHYDVVDSIWHWSSVDLGKKYFCVGYNSLYNVRTAIEKQLPQDHARADLPCGDRVWNWLILCDDKTVISIVEGRGRSPSGLSYSIPGSRQNLLNILQQLSRATSSETRNPMSLVPIRYSIDGEDETKKVDEPGLLFYYLFDDWYTTYNLIAKHRNQYGTELNKLRSALMTSADLEHVNHLHQLGRQLAVLKRMYQSYEIIMDKILQAQKPPLEASQYFSTPLVKEDSSKRTSNGDAADAADQLGLYLTSAAINRFERLRDRIRLYVLSEIQESIDLKDSLLNMNFNLISIKESNSVERLTRITLLLAKATMVFIPVSLVTGIFSVQVPDLHFTPKEFWAAFVAVLVGSLIVIFALGRISEDLERQMVYQPIHRVIWDLIKRAIRRARRRAK